MEQLDWGNLPFGYLKTDYNIRCHFKDGKWGNVEVSESEYLNMHMASTCLHYGQEIFEGLKAFRGKDGKIRIFRWEENCKRMANSASYIQMANVPKEVFKEAITKAVKLNERFVPPYGTGATLYIRPLLIGIGAEVGVKASKEYMFLVFVTPVGPYFKEGFKPVDVMITREFDRAAPLGTGHIKVGGNYAASLLSIERAHQACYTTALYLDAKEKKYIDECGQANFFAIKGNTYITPDSHSVLPSITNNSLMQLCSDLGINVERRQIPVEELASFDEVGMCGTAAVINPIRKIYDPLDNNVYAYCKDGKPGDKSTLLFKKLQGIQFGEEPDTYGWNTIIE